MNQNTVVIERIILLLSSLIALYLAVKEKRKFCIIITTLFTIGFVLTITDIPHLILTGFLLTTFCSLLVVLYALTEKHLNTFEKVIISLTGLIISIGNLFIMQHWPYWNWIKIISIIPLISFCLLLHYSQYKSKSELIFTLILVLVGIFRFINKY
jgi:hypothetical protein